jgi:hypothetical protein
MNSKHSPQTQPCFLAAVLFGASQPPFQLSFVAICITPLVAIVVSCCCTPLELGQLPQQ